MVFQKLLKGIFTRWVFGLFSRRKGCREVGPGFDYRGGCGLHSLGCAPTESKLDTNHAKDFFNIRNTLIVNKLRNTLFKNR